MDFSGKDTLEYESFLESFVSLDLLITDKNLKHAFEYFDRHNSGLLTKEDLKDILGFHHPEFEDNKENNLLNEVLKEINLNDNSSISFEQFRTLMKNVTKKNNKL